MKLSIRHFTHFGALLCGAWLSFQGSALVASDALIEEETQALDLSSSAFKSTGMDTLFQSLKNPNQFYYLPSTIRFMKDSQGEPMWTVTKYNLAYSGDQIYDEKGSLAVDPDGRVLQGGVFQATFDFGLDPGALDIIRKKVLKPGQKLGRLPLRGANIYIEYINPEEGGKSVKLGPIPAPLTDDVFSVTIPLTRSALDILKPIVETPSGTSNAPFTAYLAFSYEGYDNDYSVEVTGKSSSIMKTDHIKTGVEGQYWFFKGSADYENFKQSLLQSNAIKVTVLGDAGKDDELVDRIKSKVVDKVLENFMDFSTVSPMPGLAEGKGEPQMEAVNLNEGKKNLDGTPANLPEKKAGLAFSFSMKQSQKSEQKDFTFNWSGRTKLTKSDSRFAVLDFSYKPGNTKRHYTEAQASDWSVARPTIAVAPDVSPWFNISSVECTYADKLFKATLADSNDPAKGKLAVMSDWAQAPANGYTFKFGPVNIPPITGPDGSLLDGGAKVNRDTVFTVKYALASAGNAADRSRLEAAGVSGLESKNVLASLNQARAVFNNLYGSGQKIVLDAAKINGTAGMISESSLPPLPRRGGFMFRVVDSTKSVDWAGNVAVVPKITQQVSAWTRQLVKVKPDGALEGAEQWLERYAVDTSRKPVASSIPLENLKPDSDGFFTVTEDLFLFLNPDGSDTPMKIEFLINAGDKKGVQVNEGILVGDLIVIDVGKALSGS
ncbi:hypothetical protein FEM03_00515 [Phragmitibacter flavus]|uniref:DUF5117 domain-containing protein n=1 Tax=Phragmitibacter flavus TaxID=2576071 RepID=A0A5R8KJU1_9BACT|nr:hypothetical protein [Phragmitibacter flavus]TLD72593.1 hypothetical protein FEM03_00515 [Phragmitibacter flavus]